MGSGSVPVEYHRAVPVVTRELALSPAIPLNADGFPLRLRVAQHRTHIRQPFPDNAWPSFLMALEWRRWRKESRVQAQRSNQTHALLEASQAEFNHAVGTIPDHFDRNLGQPVAHSEHHLLGNTRNGLVPLPQRLAHCWWGCQDTEEWQRPSELRPRKCYHQGHADPA